MCDVGTATTVVGALNPGGLKLQQAQYDAGVAHRNATILDQAAGDAEVRGEQAAGVERMKGTQLIGKEHAAYAASGIDANAGSTQDVYAGTRAMSELDAQTIRNNAAREAWGYRTQATSERERARQIKKRGNVEAAGSIANSASGLAQFLLKGGIAPIEGGS